MSFTIWNASARQIFNISNYLSTDDKDEFEDFDSVLRERYDNNEEQNYNRDYSYYSVWSYVLEGKTLEQVSRDDLRILFDTFRSNTDEFEDASHKHEYYGLMLSNIRKMKNVYPELRNTNDYLTIFNYLRENVKHKAPFQPIIAPPVPESESKEFETPKLKTLGESIEDVKQKLRPVSTKNKRKRRNSYSGIRTKSFTDLLQEEVVKYNETHSIKRDIIEDICNYAIDDKERNPEKYFDAEEDQNNFKRKYALFQEQGDNFGIMFMIPDDMELFRDKYEQGMRNVRSLSRRDSQHEPLADYIITEFHSITEINRFIDDVYRSEKYKPFKISVNVACVFERIVRTQPEYTLNMFGDFGKTIFAPYIIKNDADKETFKKYLANRLSNYIDEVRLKSSDFQIINIFAFNLKVYRLINIGTMIKESLKYFCESRMIKVPLNDDNFCFDVCAVMWKHSSMKNTDCETKARRMAYMRIFDKEPNCRY